MLAPPGVRRRWKAMGSAHGWDCTTLFDIPIARPDRVLVHPAAVPTYSLSLDRPAVAVLLSTVESQESCAVPGWHAVHGRRLLGLHPTTRPAGPVWTDRPAGAAPLPGPMELYVQLPDAQVFITFAGERLTTLAGVLTEILAELSPGTPERSPC